MVDGEQDDPGVLEDGLDDVAEEMGRGLLIGKVDAGEPEDAGAPIVVEVAADAGDAAALLSTRAGGASSARPARIEQVRPAMAPSGFN